MRSYGKGNDVREYNKTTLYLSVLFIIYITDSMLLGTSSISAFRIAKRVLPIIVALYLLYKNHFSIEYDVVLVVISIVFSMVFSTHVIDGFYYFTTITLVVIGSIYTKKVDFDLFSDVYIIIVRIMAIVSIVCWFFSSRIVSFSFIPTIQNTSGNSFKFLFLTNVPIADWHRNWGPFWEPGCYQYYLNVAMLLTIYKKYKYWYLDLILFIVTAITTFSGAALLPLPFLILGLFFSRDGKKSIISVLVVVLACVLLLYFMMNGYVDEILGKLSGSRVQSQSLWIRLGSALSSLKVALHNPLFGGSLEKIEAELSRTVGSYIGFSYEGGNTNTLLCFMAFFGFPVGVYFSYELFLLCRRLAGNAFSSVMFFLAIFLTTSNENLTSSILLFILIFYGKHAILIDQKNFSQRRLNDHCRNK